MQKSLYLCVKSQSFWPRNGLVDVHFKIADNNRASQTLEMFEGDLPKIAQVLVKEWLKAHSAELQKMWDEQKIYKLPPL